MQGLISISDPERIRTFDPQLRRLMLYPTELPDQNVKLTCLLFSDCKSKKNI